MKKNSKDEGNATGSSGYGDYKASPYPKPHSYHPVLVVLYLIGLYTYIKTPLSFALVLPGIISGFAGTALLFLNLPLIRKRHIKPLLLFLMVAFASMLFAPSPIEYFIDRGKGLILLAYSMTITYGLFLEVSHWPKRSLERVFLVASLLILGGCLLENYFGMQRLSDAFRHTVYLSGIYKGDIRDLTEVGMIRPKLFTSEPSHLAKSFLLFVTTWLILSNRRNKYIIFTFLTLCALYMIRSPIVLLAFPCAIVVDLFSIQKYQFILQKTRIHRKVSFILACVLIIVIGVSSIFRNRVISLASGGDKSTIIRMVIPVFAAKESLKTNPFFGTGISGTESIVENTSNSLARFGIMYIGQEKMEDMVRNVFFLHWIYYGLIGGTLCIYFLFRYMRHLGVNNYLLCFGILLIYAQTMAGPHNVRFWSHMMITFAAATHIRKAALVKDRKAFEMLSLYDRVKRSLAAKTAVVQNQQQ